MKFGFSNDSLNSRSHEKQNLVRSLSSIEMCPNGQVYKICLCWLSRRFCIDFVSYYLLKEKRILGSLAIDVYMRMNTVDKKDNYCNKQ